MNLSKKIIGLFMLILFAFVVIGCGEATTQAPTTVAPTTVAPTTQGPTSNIITTAAVTNTEPMFVGLFTKQT